VQRTDQVIRLLRSHWRKLFALGMLLATVWVASSIVRANRIHSARVQLREVYRGIMYDGIREYYLVYSELPKSPSQAALRTPELFNRCFEAAVEFEFMEAQGFDDAQPIPSEELDHWSAIALEMQARIDQERSLESKFRHLAEPDIDPLTMLRFTESLRSAKVIADEQLDDYLKAAFEYRRLTRGLPNGAEIEMNRIGRSYTDPIPLEDRLVASKERLDTAIGEILRSIELSDNGTESPAKGGE
jgi:hypothetical protein